MSYYVLKACLSHKKIRRKDIHSQLAETIAERKKVLRRYEDMSYEEILAVTGLNPGTVKSRLNRARERLQKLLKRVADEE